MERLKEAKSTLTRKITSSVAAVITTMFSVITASAETSEANGWSSITNWGNSFANNLKGICKVIAVIAIIILAILCMSGGREWANKLKSNGGGILVGIVLASYGASLVLGLFA